MPATNIIHATIVSLYTLGTLLFFVGVLCRIDRAKKTAVTVAMVGFTFHTVSLGLWLSLESLAALPAGGYFEFLSWSVLGTFLILRWRLGIEFLALIASPLALVLQLSSLPLYTARAIMPKSMAGLFFGLHVASLFTVLGLMAMAFGAGLVFLRLDYKIKSKEKLKGFHKDLPSLSVFDKVNLWAVTVSFPLYTLGLVSGFIWARATWGRMITWDPKEMISLAIWLMFGFLFHQRLACGWRGRKPAVWAVYIFVCLALSLIWINFFLPTHHSLLFKL
ncbi:Cytochrome C assembly family protein [Desulfovibrionales bacterium]